MKKTYSHTLAVVLAVSVSLLGATANAATQTVPPGKKFSLFDKQGGKVLKTLNPGQSLPSTTQCVQITCPGNFDKTIVCWVCKDDGKAGAAK